MDQHNVLYNYIVYSTLGFLVYILILNFSAALCKGVIFFSQIILATYVQVKLKLPVKLRHVQLHKSDIVE